LAALDYFVAARAWRKGLKMAGALYEFWVYHGHTIVGLQYITTLLNLTTHKPGLESLRAYALNGAAMLSYFAGDFPAVGAYAEQALHSAQQADSARDIARARITLGMQCGGMGRFDAAINHFEQGIAAGDNLDLPWELSSLWNGLGEVARSQGRFDDALAYYSQALELSDGMGNLWLSAHILDNIGHTAYSQGRYAFAEDHVRRSMEASLALGDERGIAMCLEKLGGIAIARERHEAAATLLGAAESLREARNTPVEGMDAADYQRFVEQLRERLPADVLRSAWELGRQLQLSDIIDQTLERS
jgi:tetratricopeptide (TPR) repeat protein